MLDAAGPLTSQVQALRALAHPVRLQLLRLAAVDGAVTATSGSEQTGESRGNCSFHLRLLGKYGFLEVDAARDRRERPWRIAAAHPLADVWRQLDAGASLGQSGQSELMRRQLRLFNVEDLQAAA